MPKAYIIAQVVVSDAERYAEYARFAAVAQEKYGAKVLVRAGRHEALEGGAKPRNVILEFPNYEAAKAYYHSPEYQAARQHRLGAAQADILVVEGVEPG
jgi:uncharacterized protein (DUF1330 family)